MDALEDGLLGRSMGARLNIDALDEGRCIDALEDGRFGGTESL